MAHEVLARKIERMLAHRGELSDGKLLLLSPYEDTGIRASILAPVRGNRTVETKSVSVRVLRGSLTDQANGIVGGLMRKTGEAG